MGQRKLSEFEVETEIKSDDQIAHLKKCLSCWADKIPHHGLSNFGEKIKAVAAKSIPSYVVVFKVQYEKRQLLQKTEPFRGKWLYSEHIPVNNEREMWLVDLPVPNNFCNCQKDYGVSENVFNCQHCGATGQVVCRSCNGMGRQRCGRCGGTHHVPCGRCGGQTTVPCSECSGNGKIVEPGNNGPTRYITCPSCNTGRRICSQCGGRGQEICSNCGPDGYVTCQTCYGSGKNTCPSCQGAGQLVTCVYIQDSFWFRDSLKAVHHESVPKEEGIRIAAFMKSEEVDFELLETEISKETFTSANHKSVKQACEKLLDQAKKKARFLKGHIQRNRIVKEQFQITKVKVSIFDYKFQEKTYRAWIYGKDKVCAPVSPLSEISNKLFNNAKEAFKKEDYSLAADLADKAVEMFDRKEYKEFRDKVHKVINRQYLKGAIIGGTICPIVGNLFGIVIGHILYNTFSFYIRTSRRRFFCAFWTSFIINSVLLASLVFIWVPFLQPK